MPLFAVIIQFRTVAIKMVFGEAEKISLGLRHPPSQIRKNRLDFRDVIIDCVSQVATK